MSPGGPSLGDNRFALLSSSPKPKRKKVQNITKEIFPALPSVKKDNPKYIAGSAINSNKPLNKYSCFAVHKALKNISSENIEISNLRDGSLLLFVKNASVAKKFLATTKLVGICDAKFEMHHNLNHSKGTIFAPCLNDIPEAEIVENMSDQGVVSAYKFVKHIEGQTIASGVVLLTFDLYTLPEKVEVSWYTTKVRPYYPNPMRCRNCQILGHTTKRCNNTPVCDTCALPPHTPSPCSRTLCVNCSGNHAASNRTCPKYVQMKQIIVIKTDKKCSMREAIKIHRMQIPPALNEHSLSFSTAIKNSTSNQQINPNNEISTSNLQNNSTHNSNEKILKRNSSNENIPNTPTTSFKSTSTLSSNNNYNIHLETGFLSSNSNNDNISTCNINAKENNENTDGTIDLAAINAVDNYTPNIKITSLLSQLSSSDSSSPPPPLSAYSNEIHSHYIE